jgi:hypothetical protein
MKETKESTTAETAKRFNVKPVTVRKWLLEGRFKNARQEDTPRGVVWYIPEIDLENFELPQRGRPKEAKK